MIDYKRQQYEEMLQQKGNLNNIAMIDSIPMILEKPVGQTVCGNAYNEIFGEGNSFESIFELVFLSSQSVKNDMVSKFYGNDRTPQGNLSASDILFKDVAQGSNSLFKKTDGRAYEGGELSGARYIISKYVRTRVSYRTNPAPSTEKDLNLSQSLRA